MRSSVRSRLAPLSLGLKGLDEVSSRLKLSYPFRCDLSVSLSAKALSRAKAGWGEACSRKVREDPKAQRRPVIILSLEQPVVGLEPDRSDPRMRLKQNWSFQAKTCVVERLPIINRHTKTRALAMRAIKCLKGIWWMPWR